jgi:hypothetical protein
MEHVKAARQAALDALQLIRATHIPSNKQETEEETKELQNKMKAP